MVTDHAEPTFALLRYSLGGYRPSKTDRLPWFPVRFHGPGLDFPISKGGVSLTAPQIPKDSLQSLPLTLSIKIRKPVTAYS